MASPNADLKTRVAALRQGILSYKPGKAVPCDDERVVFPDKLVIGMIDLSRNAYNIDVLRRALHGDVEPSKLAGKRQTSNEDHKGYLTDSISVIALNCNDGYHVHSIQKSHHDQTRSLIILPGEWEKALQDFAGKVGCMVQLFGSLRSQYFKPCITMIKEVTGRASICALLSDGDIPKARNKLKQLGITHIYEVSRPADRYSDEKHLQWLNLLHRCLQEGDRALAINELKKICKNPRCKSLYEKTKKEARREVERLQTQKEDDRARAEKEKLSLAAEMTKKLESKQQHVETLTKTVGEKERNETTLRQQLEELTKGREEDIARAEKEKGALAADMTKKLESKQQRVDTLIDIVDEKERNETTLKQQVQALKKGREGDRARFEKEKQSIELSWKKELESKEQQLERENWKLRTKIQLESEIRSAEQKKKAETHPWCFIPWGTSGKQAQGGTSSFEDNSTGGLERRDTLRAGEEPPDDEFAGILQQIADDLYDEAKIDSLAGQLGILHGDIQRALMTNVKFNRVTSDGTRHMLKQWRRGVSREEERMELRKALRAAQLVNIADLYLSEGDMTSKNQEDLTDGSKSQHPEQSPERSRENLNASDVISEDVASEEVHAGDNMTNLSSIQPSKQSSSHAMQVLPKDMSPGGKPNKESTILDKSPSLLTCQRPVLMKRPAVGERRQKRKQRKPSNLLK